MSKAASIPSTITRRAALACAASPWLLVACGGGGSSAPEPPQVSRQPADATVTAGASATFSVEAGGSATSFQWLRSGVEIPGATQATLTVPSVSLLESGATFAVRVGNSAGSVTSRVATLTATSPALTILAGAPTSPDPIPLPGTSTSGYVDATGSAARFDSSSPIAVDGAGNIYVAAGPTIRKVTPQGVVTTFVGNLSEFRLLDGTAATARFVGIVGLEFDRARQLLLAVDYSDTASETVVREVTLSGDVTTVQRTTGAYFEEPAFAPDGTLYALHGTSSRGALGGSVASAVYRLPPSGPGVLIAGNPDVRGFKDGIGKDALFSAPSAILPDGKGNVYVADNACLRRIGPDGTVVTIAGAPPSLPAGTPAGSLTLIDGTGPAARFGVISDLALESSGNILVVDHGEALGSNRPENLNLIRRVTPDGRVTSVARSGATEFRGAWRLALGNTGVAHALGFFWVGRFEPFAG